MIKINKDYKFEEVYPKISAYTYVKNAQILGYPLYGSLESAAKIFDEVVVVDAESDDSTPQLLNSFKEQFPNLKVYRMPMSESPGRDGEMKSMARAMTINPIGVQFDIDEIFCGSKELWQKKAKMFHLTSETDIANLLVVEPFGNINRLRVNESHNPLKWRLYKNKPEICHGIPKHDRLEKDGKVYSKGMSDGCFPINILSNELVPVSTESKLMNLVKLKESKKFDEYKECIEDLIKTEPFVLHIGHVDLIKKIQLYISSWHKLWCELYDKDPDDLNNNQYFPGSKMSEISYSDIKEKVNQLIKETEVVELDMDLHQIF